MSRYADQLPLITEPSAANFLIATDENDPKALVRIPAESLGNGGGSTEYTIINDIDLNATQSIELSSGAYIFNGSVNANVDLDLVDGDRIEFINQTSNKVVFYGLTGWLLNGTLTNIIPEGGLVLEKGGLIAAFINSKLAFLYATTLKQGSGPYRPVIDPFGANVVFFLKGIGENNSKNILDSSSNNLPVVANGATAISTAQAKYNASSIYCFENSANFLSSSNLNIPFSNTFTIEGWYRFPTWNDSRSFFEIKPSNNNSWMCAAYSNTVAVFANAQAFVFNTGFTPSSNVWFHLAVTCNAGTLRVFVNGVQRGSNYSYTNASWNVNYIWIGKDAYSKNTAYVSHFRITAQACRYVANFNPEDDTFLDI